MNLEQIKTHLASENPQDRLRGITALRQFEPEIAAPILLSSVMDEPVLMVRSLLITSLGYKRTDAGFDRLVEIMTHDADPNLRAEAVGAISKYGAISVPLLVQHSYLDQHWLSQMSVVLALPELDCPEQLLEVCTNILRHNEVAVQIVALEQLPCLADTSQESAALELLLQFAQHEQPLLRRAVAVSLPAFDHPEARTALRSLRYDSDHRVVAATLEVLIP